jgi:uncharacterized membrane protein (DUF485 family)
VTDDDRAALRTIAARRLRLAAALTAVMVVAYFGFILLIAFDKPTAGTLLADGRLSVGIVIGALVIVLAPVLTGIYVRWANRRHDAALAELRARRGTK